MRLHRAYAERGGERTTRIAGPPGIANVEHVMWWQDLLWGFWNGLTAWIVLILHVFSYWESQPFYDVARSGNWYDLGFLLGAGSPFLGLLGRKAA
jgi:hypothetical protein